MTAGDIRFVDTPTVPELYSSYVIVTREGDNYALKFYRQRPIRREAYDVSDIGEVVGLEEEPMEFEGILQASLTLSDFAAYHLLNSLKRVGANTLFEAKDDE